MPWNAGLRQHTECSGEQSEVPRDGSERWRGRRPRRRLADQTPIETCLGERVRSPRAWRKSERLRSLVGDRRTLRVVLVVCRGVLGRLDDGPDSALQGVDLTNRPLLLFTYHGQDAVRIGWPPPVMWPVDERFARRPVDRSLPDTNERSPQARAGLSRR